MFFLILFQMYLLYLLLLPPLLVLLTLSLLLFGWRYLAARRKKTQDQGSNVKTVGFFHPYCNAGGGGERVLWCAVQAIQKKYPNVRCIVYTGDCDATSEEILANAEKTFNIKLPRKVEFVHLKKRNWVEAHCYPYFTLLGQSFGSMVLGYEAFSNLIPDVYLDTMGYAFTFFLFKYIGQCKIGCYVHYPTISTDMLDVVSDRTGSFNNRAIIANSSILTNFKLLYYKLFASLYGLAGSRADLVMVNSTWTKGHIKLLWKQIPPESIHKIFPPCDIQEFLKLPLQRKSAGDSSRIALSIGQFRPEKNHTLQITSFARFLSMVPMDYRFKYKLVLVGGCRNEGDRARVEELKSLSSQLGVSDNMEVKTNIPFSELKDLLATSDVGIHTMTNEHFGIGVVEFQAAGVIALAHNSGGPKMDIVIETNFKMEKNCKTGYLASTPEEYAKSLHEIFELQTQERESIAEAAREACSRFSENHFENDFLNAVKKLM